jgi:hypothetical protein
MGAKTSASFGANSRPMKFDDGGKQESPRGKVTVIFLIVATQSADGAAPALKLKNIAGFYEGSATT